MSESDVNDNFLGIPEEFSSYAASKVAILPIPFDGTSTYAKGADSGPRALITASQQIELYDIEAGKEVYRAGIHTLPPVIASTAEEMVRKSAEALTRPLDDGKFCVVLGGEHSVSYSPIKLHCERYPGLSVLQLDAHSDLRAEYHGSPLNHACIMARAQEWSDNVVSVGIRSQDSSELPRVKREKMWYADDIFLDGPRSKGWIDAVVRSLGEKVYITIDLDVFDPSIMPSTGTPEPGGLQWYETLKLLKAVCAAKQVVGFDVVELCPRDGQHAPDFLAARLVYKLIGYCVQGR